MRYTDAYIINHDIDWFCVYNGIYIHVASAGGNIPNLINDDKTLSNTQHQVELLPNIYADDEIEYNEIAISEVLGNNENKGRQQYIESFTTMARKGFVSIDKTNIGDANDNRYHVVCRPKRFRKGTRRSFFTSIESGEFDERVANKW